MRFGAGSEPGTQVGHGRPPLGRGSHGALDRQHAGRDHRQPSAERSAQATRLPVVEPDQKDWPSENWKNWVSSPSFSLSGSATLKVSGPTGVSQEIPSPAL